MPWVRFSEPFNWLVPERNGSVSIQYKSGHSYLVTTPCAKEAVAKGKAVEMTSPRQSSTSRKNSSSKPKTRAAPDAQSTD